MALLKTHKPTLSEADTARLVRAIEGAERGNRGEVRVHVESRGRGAAIDKARRVFYALHMDRTQAGTGVLLYVCLDAHEVAVYAGPGIYGATDAGFWQGVTDTVARAAKEGDLVGGLERALEQVGELLRASVPGGSPDELPNAVTTG